METVSTAQKATVKDSIKSVTSDMSTALKRDKALSTQSEVKRKRPNYLLRLL